MLRREGGCYVERGCNLERGDVTYREGMLCREESGLEFDQWIPDDDDFTLFPPCSPLPPALMH